MTDVPEDIMQAARECVAQRYHNLRDHDFAGWIRTGKAEPYPNQEVNTIARALLVERERATATLLDWAVGKWVDEVKNRPLNNIHRRTLDITWRQVIRHTGGDAEKLLGPAHDDLLSRHQEPRP